MASGRDEDRDVRHIRERHEPSWMGPARDQVLPLRPRDPVALARGPRACLTNLASGQSRVGLDEARVACPRARPDPAHVHELCDLSAASPLGVSGTFVGEKGEAVTDGPVAGEAHGLLVAGLAEEALAGPEHDRVDHQP